MVKMKIVLFFWTLCVLANKYNVATALLFYNFSMMVSIQLYAKYSSKFGYVKYFTQLEDVY